MLKFVTIRDFIIIVAGTWYFEFYLDYKLPSENNLLLFFVAIPIVWATLTQLWTSYSYADVHHHPVVNGISHTLSILMLASSVFVVSTVLNTVGDVLDDPGIIFFHGMGWTVLLALVLYDMIDVIRWNRKENLREEQGADRSLET